MSVIYRGSVGVPTIAVIKVSMLGIQAPRGKPENSVSVIYRGSVGVPTIAVIKVSMLGIQERVLLKVVGLDVGVDVNVDFTTKVTHTYVAFYVGA